MDITFIREEDSVSKKHVLVGLVALTLVIALWELFPSYTYRFQVTISAQVGGEVRTAFSVVQLKAQKQPKFLPEVHPYSMWLTGEAVFLDLGSGRNVIATLRAGPLGEIRDPYWFYVRALGVGRGPETIPNLPVTGTTASLTGKDMPTLVSFTDISDPSSVRVVTPDQFPTFFGPDVRFLGAEVTVTRDAVTTGIEAKLPWLRDLRDRLKGRELSSPDRFNVLPSAFIRE